jgi:hypothetical protein
METRVLQLILANGVIRPVDADAVEADQNHMIRLDRIVVAAADPQSVEATIGDLVLRNGVEAPARCVDLDPAPADVVDDVLRNSIVIAVDEDSGASRVDDFAFRDDVIVRLRGSLPQVDPNQADVRDFARLNRRVVGVVQEYAVGPAVRDFTFQNLVVGRVGE